MTTMKEGFTAAAGAEKGPLKRVHLLTSFDRRLVYVSDLPMRHLLSVCSSFFAEKRIKDKVEIREYTLDGSRGDLIATVWPDWVKPVEFNV